MNTREGNGIMRGVRRRSNQGLCGILTVQRGNSVDIPCKHVHPAQPRMLLKLIHKRKILSHGYYYLSLCTTEKRCVGTICTKTYK